MAKMTYAHIQISLQSKADDDACFFSVATTLHRIFRAESVLHTQDGEGAPKQHTKQHGRSNLTSPYVPTESFYRPDMQACQNKISRMFLRT